MLDCIIARFPSIKPLKRTLQLEMALPRLIERQTIEQRSSILTTLCKTEKFQKTKSYKNDLKMQVL